MASDVHKRRTGRSLHVTERAVRNEEVYEEEIEISEERREGLAYYLAKQVARFEQRLANEIERDHSAAGVIDWSGGKVSHCLLVAAHVPAQRSVQASAVYNGPTASEQQKSLPCLLNTRLASIDDESQTVGPLTVQPDDLTLEAYHGQHYPTGFPQLETQQSAEAET